MTIVSEPATAPAAPAPRTRPTDVLVALLLIAVARLLPVVAACVVCWLIDRAEQHQTQGAR